MHALLRAKKSRGGRNNMGRITTRHQGGGHKQHYRVIDFKRDKDGIVGRVERMEYDPNRTAHIALVLYKDGERRYIIAPKDVEPARKSFPAATPPSRRATRCRSEISRSAPRCIASNCSPARARRWRAAPVPRCRWWPAKAPTSTLRLRSGEMRKVHIDCRATIGEVGFGEHNLRQYGKAGARRWKGIRPTVRGVVMNPIDHPHGGGEGKTSGGRHPVSPWGQPTKGYKTRANKRTDGMIVRRRKAK